METELIRRLDLQCADLPEQCTCVCPDGEGQHLESCHIYDSIGTGTWRRAVLATAEEISDCLKAEAGPKCRNRVLESIRQLIRQVRELRECELADQNRLKN
jgi:hypothetical protein